METIFPGMIIVLVLLGLYFSPRSSQQRGIISTAAQSS